MRTRAQPFRSNRGFTLLELLLGTVVGSIVLIVIQTTFFGALRLHNTTHQKIDSERVVQRALDIVRRDLSGLMLPGGSTLVGHLQTGVFSSSTSEPAGERVSPDFFTSSGRIDGWTPFSEVQQVAYYLAPGPDSMTAKNLVRAVTRNLLPVQEGTLEEQILLSGVDAVSVMFFDGTGWTDQWDSEATSTLPTAIKFSLTLVAPNPQVALEPIELVVPVLVTTPTSQAQALEEAVL